MTDFVMKKGDTFIRVWRWSASTFTYKAITAITKGAPVRITCVGHVIPNGHKVAVESVKGMTQINAASTPPKDKEYHLATVIDANTVDLNDVNSSNYSNYTSGGFLRYHTPIVLTGFSARGKIKDKEGGTVLLDITSLLVIDTAAKTITLTIPAATAAAATWKKGVYDIELYTAADAYVKKIDAGKFTLKGEITT